MRSRPYRLRGKPKPTPRPQRPRDGAGPNAKGDNVDGPNAAIDHVADGVGAGGEVWPDAHISTKREFLRSHANLTSKRSEDVTCPAVTRLTASCRSAGITRSPDS